MRFLITFILWSSITSFAATQTLPEMSAVDLFISARSSISQDDPKTAILYLNTLLNMPQNDYTQEAQELIGMARESVGETDKAKAEYESYLRMYPDGVNSDRVRKRLEQLTVTPISKEEKKPKREINENVASASISQYYYGGTDVSSLITNFEASDRYRYNEWDTKVVFRDVQIHNMLKNSVDRNNVVSAYFEQTNKEQDYTYRIGRQTSSSQGALNRFDGATIRYRISPQFKLTGIIGAPDYGSHNSVQTSRYFYGAGVELNDPNIPWSGSVYGIQEIADGIAERKAIGSEVRYFNGDNSVFGAMEYDTLYKEINLAMLQGTFVANSYTFNMLLDHRKTGILNTESALSSVVGAVSVADLRRQLSTGEIYSLVKSVVADSDTMMIGVTKDFTKEFRVGVDLRAMNIGATDGNSVIAPQSGISDNYTLTLQAIANKVLWSTDMVILMTSMVEDPHYSARNISATHSLTLDDWRFTETVRYYNEVATSGHKTTSINPVVRVQYQLNKNTSIEAELNLTHTTTEYGSDWREMIFLGYRMDFR